MTLGATLTLVKDLNTTNLTATASFTHVISALIYFI